MVTSEEIVERTVYICLLNKAIEYGVTINPDLYLPITQESNKQYEADIKALKKFIPIFGIGNNQVRGVKTLPRITIELQGYYPGDIGVNKYIIGDKTELGYQVSEFPFETKDITIDIHLVAENQSDMRLLHNIMYDALPSRGYVKPYFNDLGEWKSSSLGPTGNLYLEVGNWYDHQDLNHGFLEKVYQYVIKDGILPEKLPEDGILTPITDISVLIQAYENQGITLKIP